MWEIEIDGRVEGPFDTAGARRLLASRPGLAQAPIRMAQADPESAESGPGPWRTPADFGFDKAADEDAPQTTRGLELRARWLRGLTIILIGASVAMIGSAVYTLEFLARIRAEGLVGDPQALAEAEMIDFLSGVSGVVYLISLVGAAIAYCYWVNRAARHARQLRSDVMTISPDWAVGWCFVPIANLWMPFKAVGQIWRATALGGGALAQSSGLLWLWWVPYVMSNVLGNASFRLDMQGDGMSMTQSLQFGIASDVCNIVGCAALLAVSARITAAQRAWNPAEVFE